MWLDLTDEAGQTPIDVTVIRLPARTWIGSRPAASVLVTTITRQVPNGPKG